MTPHNTGVMVLRSASGVLDADCLSAGQADGGGESASVGTRGAAPQTGLKCQCCHLIFLADLTARGDSHPQDE
ncbi:MAG: hypothetical protein ACRDRW_04400 [Pseudonocardiaceae bacterium]